MIRLNARLFSRLSVMVLAGLSGAALNALASGPPPRPLVIILNTSEYSEAQKRSAARPEVDAYSGLKIIDAEIKYPGADIRVIHADSNAGIRKALDELLAKNPGARVEALIVKSHGTALTGPRHQPLLLNNSEEFGVAVDSPIQVKEVFGPLLGRLTDQPTLQFEGCSTLAGATDADAKSALTRVLQAFGLSSGTVVLNQTDHLDARAVTMIPIDAAGEQRSVRAFMQLTAPISYPILWVQERLLNRAMVLHQVPGAPAEFSSLNVRTFARTPNARIWPNDPRESGATRPAPGTQTQPLEKSTKVPTNPGANPARPGR